MRRTGRVQTVEKKRVRRSIVVRCLLTLSVLVLGAALYRLQVVDVERYALAARNNRLRPLPVPAPRGTIYDRHGRVVAGNRVGYRVLLMPGPRDVMTARIAELAPLLALDDAAIERAWRDYNRAPHLPMVLLEDGPASIVARLQERRFLFPGVLIHEYAQRYYPSGATVAHLIGYVNEISEAQLDRPEFRTYRAGQWIGQQGLEAEYELSLGGTPGVRYLEIDARGRIRRWLPPEVGLPPVPGRDLQLYLDLDLQEYIAGIFPKGYKGAFVALEPGTGGVLALYSHPSYDPNLFTGGISHTDYDQLASDTAKPLLDRATGSRQPPASAWKLMIASMALEEGVIKPKEIMPIRCSGGLYYGGRYARCWLESGHGAVDLIRGITWSCDVYFYQVGIRIKFKRMLELGTRLGFAKPTGIDLPTEIANVFPDGPDFWVKRFGYRPFDNEVLSLSIGQGLVAMTPLKMAVLYSALARPDGRAFAPRLAKSDTTAPVAVDLGLSPQSIAWLRRGMRRVVAPGGTAALSRLRDWDFMGKTGTAQACANCDIKDHAWFIGIAGPRGGEPEIVAALFLENAEHGYTASGVVANALNFYLNRKYGRPFDPYPTPRERGPLGLPVDWNWYGSPVEDPPDAISDTTGGR